MKTIIQPWYIVYDRQGKRRLALVDILSVLLNPQDFDSEFVSETIGYMLDEDFAVLIDYLRDKKWTESEIKELCDFRTKFKEEQE